VVTYAILRPENPWSYSKGPACFQLTEKRGLPQIAWRGTLKFESAQAHMWKLKPYGSPVLGSRTLEGREATGKPGLGVEFDYFG
jgi:hypothetical protein